MTTVQTLDPTSVRGERRPLRSVGAVLAGLFAIFAVSHGVDTILRGTGVFPPMDAPPMSSALFLLALSYRLVICVAGCMLTAHLAPDRPMGHALALGGIGLVLSIAGAAAMWGMGPAWYPIALALSALPSGWLGGWLVTRRR